MSRISPTHLLRFVSKPDRVSNEMRREGVQWNEIHVHVIAGELVRVLDDPLLVHVH